jgi:hypothetical protein
MRSLFVTGLSVCVLAGVSVAHAAKDTIDCAKESLASAVATVKDKDLTMQFTGTCAGPIVIRTEGLTLKGVGAAVIDGGGHDAVTIDGASRVTLSNADVRNGLTGVLGVNGAHFTLSTVAAHDNAVFGVSVQTGSSAVLSDVTTIHNGIHGLDVQTGSAATVTGSLTSSTNGVFGINVNGSAITFSQATVVANGNALGIQIATGGNAFLNDSATTIEASNNLSVGVTVVSGAHLVSFGGKITASGNPVAGVSVNSKGGLDLDAASTLTSTTNGAGLLLQEASVMTVFNTPQFSGAPGFSTVTTMQNTGDGVRVLSGSTLILVNQARVVSTQNGRVGLIADDGSGVTLVNSTLTGNLAKDLQLTFGARGNLNTVTFGTYTCDATVLVRGTSGGIVCPH